MEPHKPSPAQSLHQLMVAVAVQAAKRRVKPLPPCLTVLLDPRHPLLPEMDPNDI
jgi:hypothetical protein